MSPEMLIGKTITSAKRKKLISHDDSGYLELGFSDGTFATIISGYGAYTGNSYDEYPTNIGITDEEMEELEDYES